MTDWKALQSCTRTCGGGIEAQVREVVKDAVAGGLPCGKRSRTVPCNEHACPMENCEVGPWTDVGICSASCNGGMITQMRHMIKAARHGGTPCPDTVRKQPCNKEKCPG